MYKLVVFDLDGTIADTLKDLAVAVNTALSDNNLPIYPEYMYRQFVGNGIDNLISTVMGECSADKNKFDAVKSRFSEYYSLHCNDYTTAYDGINQMLCEFERLGVKTAVLSNKPHIYMRPIADKLYPKHNFCYLWGNQEKYPKKPNPKALLDMMKLLFVSKADTLYVGDSDVDVLTAHNAGVRCCGVKWGFRGEEELINAGADYIATDVSQLLEIIVNNRGAYES